MTTFAQSLAARRARWIVGFTIEGHGETDGDGVGTLYRYVSETPNYATAGTYRPWLMDWPKLGAEKVDPAGGLPESSELEVMILDVGDALTSAWRTESRPITYATSALDGSGTSVDVEDPSVIAAAYPMWIGNEALGVDGSPSGSTVTVVRGQLDTDPTPHEIGAPVFGFIPYIEGRRVRMFIAPKDASSSSEEREIGAFRIDQVELTDDLCGWVLRGTSQLRWFGRLAARRSTTRYELGGANIGERYLWAVRAGEFDARYREALPVWPGSSLLLRHGENGEVFAAGVDGQAGSIVQFSVTARGLYGTPVAEFVTGTPLIPVFGADPLDVPAAPTTFFRFAGAGSPSSTRDGTWTPSAHFVDLILNLALSAADVADGFELANRDTSHGAWDCLPVGLGIGVPHNQIDFAAALAVKGRTPEYQFPNFVVGEAPIPFADLVGDALLKPIGGFFSTAGGKARIVLPRMPLAGETTIEIGPDDILRRQVSRQVYSHRIAAKKDTEGLLSTIVYELAGGNKIVVHNSDFGPTYGQAGYYASEDRTLEIKALAARVDQAGTSQLLEAIAQRRLLRSMRPPWVVQTPRDWGGYGLAVGDLLALTYWDLPDLATGTRGWSGVPVEIAETTPKLDAEEGLAWTHVLRSFPGQGLAGRIAPSAVVTSASDPGGGDRACAVLSNRYTKEDAAGTLPTNDALAFAVGDVVRLYNFEGIQIGGAAQTVVDVAVDEVTVDGDFGGVLSTGSYSVGFRPLLRYAGSADASTTQLDRFVFLADASDRTIGATARRPWRYGLP